MRLLARRLYYWADEHPLQARIAALVFVLTCMAFALFA
jgi:hypothetical protein